MDPESHGANDEFIQCNEEYEDFREIDTLEQMEGVIVDLQGKLAKKESEADSNRKLWKKAILELDRIRPRQGFEAANDHELAVMAMNLRYNIRNFAIQYFEGEHSIKRPLGRANSSRQFHGERPRDRLRRRAGSTLDGFGGDPSRQRPVEPTGAFKDYLTDAAPANNAYKSYLKSSRKRPNIIQSFLWNVLDGEIFGKFLWADAASQNMRDLEQFLTPREYSPKVEATLSDLK